MKLNLQDRFTEEELTEIRKRAYSFAEQMFMQGVTVGRDLNREDLYNSTEDFIKAKISAMTAYFVRDDIWEAMPPRGYNPDPAVGVPEPNPNFMSHIGNVVKNAAEGPINVVNNNAPNEDKPDWADEKRPFK